ncbi:hypothetical protein SmJEL517_g00545 [Synchytrium microbalum]|uniref:Uncharacterized protein n=1 Tax=Synchytrium microbalum TaxID=1806994 RepID=A0A507C7D8_9FUNG|nr:uncharacterized protein SmJEL517_g00545 [Synchytrium microbalum]TPX37490.1 hypothetical protein SmJEL517_g00545 [Synchytrium microbalum]
MSKAGSSGYAPLGGAPSYYQNEDLEGQAADKFGQTVAQSSVEVRLGFVRKVYSLLAAQLLLTTIFSAAFLYSPAVQDFSQNNSWLLFVSMFGSLGVLIALIWKRKSHPTNMWLLFTFTVLESYTVGNAVTFYDSETVLQAVVLTFALFFGLTLFTLQSKMDFTGLGPFLFGSLWLVIIAGFIEIFLPFNKMFDLFLALFIVILFCGYIVYDTQMIFERLSPDEYIIAAVELYLDLLNLFLAILRVLEDARR